MSCGDSLRFASLSQTRFFRHLFVGTRKTHSRICSTGVVAGALLFRSVVTWYAICVLLHTGGCMHSRSEKGYEGYIIVNPVTLE